MRIKDQRKFPFEITEGFERPDDWNTKIDAAVVVRGEVFFVNRDDLGFVCSRRFYINPSGYMDYGGGSKKVLYHRMVMNAPVGMVVDHVNRNRRDNRRRHLRITTTSGNQANKRGKNPPGLRGVVFRSGRWRASIGFNNKKIGIGAFETKEDAARAYDIKATELFGQYAITNFPKENYTVPEKCLADGLGPTIIVRQKTKLRCLWPHCKQNAKPGTGHCSRHDRAIRAREDKRSRGERLRVIGRDGIEFCTSPEHRGEKIKARHTGLCQFHYERRRRESGLKRNRKRYGCDYAGPGGVRCGRTAIKIKERLCSTHHKEKHGLFKKVGAPKQGVGPCSVCGEPGSVKTGLCKKHYIKKWRSRSLDRKKGVP